MLRAGLAFDMAHCPLACSVCPAHPLDMQLPIGRCLGARLGRFIRIQGGPCVYWSSVQIVEGVTFSCVWRRFSIFYLLQNNILYFCNTGGYQLGKLLKMMNNQQIVHIVLGKHSLCVKRDPTQRHLSAVVIHYYKKCLNETSSFHMYFYQLHEYNKFLLECNVVLSDIGIKRSRMNLKYFYLHI